MVVQISSRTETVLVVVVKNISIVQYKALCLLTIFNFKAIDRFEPMNSKLYYDCGKLFATLVSLMLNNSCIKLKFIYTQGLYDALLSIKLSLK